MSKHAVKSAGGIATKRCPVCHRDVLSAHRGEVTAVGQGEIVSVSKEGHVVGQCGCGKRVEWKRELTAKP